MNLLGIDTSTLRGTIAIRRGDGARFAATTDPGRRHGQDLVPAIRDLLTDAGLRASEIGIIGVGLGPGSYTGLRVGLMAAKTLAYACGAKLVGLDSLEFFARAASGEFPLVTVLSDAQRGDFHVADFRRDPGGILRRAGDTRIESREELLASRTASRIVTGPGLSKWQGQNSPPLPLGEGAASPSIRNVAWGGEAVGSGPATPHPAAMPPPSPPRGEGIWSAEIAVPDPLWLLDMMEDSIDRDQFVSGWTLEPIYLRRSAAEDQWEKRR